MDRYGRRFIAVPSLVILALGYIAVPLTESALTPVAVLTIGGVSALGAGVMARYIPIYISWPEHRPGSRGSGA